MIKLNLYNKTTTTITTTTTTKAQEQQKYIFIYDHVIVDKINRIIFILDKAKSNEKVKK